MPTPTTVPITEEEVRREFRRINTRKAAGPDGIPGRVLRACSAELAGVFTRIFNLSLTTCKVPACFKSSTIIPVPKKNKVTCLNDWRPVALTPIVSKCFERIVKRSILRELPSTLDPHQFAYRQNRSTDDAIDTTLHNALMHLDNPNTYVRMLFIDYSSAFNTIVPSILDTKLGDLGLNPNLRSWTLDFLSDRRQVVRMGPHTSSPLTLNTGAPQGCVLSPLLYSLYTHDCVATHSSNLVIKYADDTTVTGLITNGDETAYRREVENLTKWCQVNNLTLNVDKTKELVIDYRRGERGHDPVHIGGAAVERVDSFKFLGVHITEKLDWGMHTGHVVRKAQQRLYHLRRLRKFGIGPHILRAFYRCTTESILTGCTTAWYGNANQIDRQALERVVRTAGEICGCKLPSIASIFTERCVSKAHRILKDPSHPNHKLFELMPSGRRYRSLRSTSKRTLNSYFHRANRLLTERL